jgi:hypothetical protein
MHPGQIIRSAVSCVCLVRPPGDQNRTSKRTYHNTDVRTASVMTQAGPITLRRIAGRARETLMAWRVPGHAASQSRDHTREPLSVDEMLLRHRAPPCGGWPLPNHAGRHGAAERRAARRSGGTCAGRCVPTVAPRWPAAGKGGRARTLAGSCASARRGTGSGAVSVPSSRSVPPHHDSRASRRTAGHACTSDTHRARRPHVSIPPRPHGAGRGGPPGGATGHRRRPAAQRVAPWQRGGAWRWCDALASLRYDGRH